MEQSSTSHGATSYGTTYYGINLLNTCGMKFYAASTLGYCGTCNDVRKPVGRPAAAMCTTSNNHHKTEDCSVHKEGLSWGLNVIFLMRMISEWRTDLLSSSS